MSYDCQFARKVHIESSPTAELSFPHPYFLVPSQRTDPSVPLPFPLSASHPSVAQSPNRSFGRGKPASVRRLLQLVRWHCIGLFNDQTIFENAKCQRQCELYRYHLRSFREQLQTPGSRQPCFRSAAPFCVNSFCLDADPPIRSVEALPRR